MKKEDFIYTLYRIILNNKIYFGITNNLTARKSQHKNRALKKKINTPLYTAIRKYGWENVKIEEFALFNDLEELKKQEIINISLHNTRDRKIGYNICAGGEGAFGREPWNKGKPILQHVKEALMAAKPEKPRLGIPHTKESLLKIKEMVKAANLKRGHGPNKGKKTSEATKEKIRAKNKGRVPPNKGIKMSHKQWLHVKESRKKVSKIVMALDLHSGMPLYFDSILHASKELHLSRSTIRDNSCKRYYFEINKVG